MPIVRHGHARMRRLEPPVARPRGHRRPTTTATAQPILTTGVLTRRNSRRNVTPRPTTATAALRSHALTIRHPRVLIRRHRRRERIPRRAAAIQLRRVPTPHRATAIAVAAAEVVAVEAEVVAEARTAAAGAAAVTAAVEAEAHTVAEGPVLTATANLFANSTARPDLPGGLFVFRRHIQINFCRLASRLFPIAFGITPTQLFGPFGVK